MTEQTPAPQSQLTDALTQENLIKILDAASADIPKLQAFLTAAQNNPMVLTLATKLFPGLAPIIPILAQISPYLSFLKGLVDQLETTLKS